MDQELWTHARWASGQLVDAAAYAVAGHDDHHLESKTIEVSNKVAATSRFDCLHYLTLRYGRYLRSTTSRT